ncbi:MAG TPA: amidohydrolase family protein [Bryobacteraceae bacterium]|nr:amidohydrolase family protein [Bryobacteraceae bacterium]
MQAGSLRGTISPAILAALLITSASAQPQETGKFVLHKFGSPIGEETYQISPDGDSLVTKSNFLFTDRGAKVPLTTTLRTTAGLVPQHFETKGQSSRISTIDDAVDIANGRATIRENKSTREATVPDRYFTIAGYAPAAIQMQMMRYWAKSGRPNPLPVFPNGAITIEPRGEDKIGDATLKRYTITGLIWGRETLWLDDKGDLAALVSIDAEFDHFEAIRETYEAALPTFLSSAARDNMAALASLSQKLSPPTQGPIAIVNATLIDGTGALPVADATVVLDGNRIVAAGPKTKVKIPSKATRIDATGRYILPGLWDMHSHYEQVEWGPIYLAAGVTTVRDCGNELEFITAVRDAIREGKGLGPRLLLAGLIDGAGKMSLGAHLTDDPTQAVAFVNEYHKAGFEQIKIYESVKPDALKAITAEAHRLGMTVTGHVPSGLTAFQAVEAGMDQINHLLPKVYLSAFPAGTKGQFGILPPFKPDSDETQAAIRFYKEHGTVLDPTMSVYDLTWHPSDKPLEQTEPGAAKLAPELRATLANTGIPSSFVSKVRPGFDGALAFIAALHRAGVPIVVGTDQTIPGYSVYREMELYVAGGMPPMDAIQAATIVPARAMKLDRDSGTVEAGKRADLILVDANPLESISNIRRVHTVFANGHMFDPAPLWRSVGFTP